jgi:hypothetical protein
MRCVERRPAVVLAPPPARRRPLPTTAAVVRSCPASQNAHAGTALRAGCGMSIPHSVAAPAHMRCTARVLIFHNVPYATFSLQRYQPLTRLLCCTKARSAGRAQDVDCCGAEPLAQPAFGENPGRGGAAGEFALPRENCASKLGIWVLQESHDVMLVVCVESGPAGLAVPCRCTPLRRRYRL